MAISQVATISFLIYHSYGKPNCRYCLTDYERAILNFIRSTFCSLTPTSFCLLILVVAERGIFSNIKPFRNQEGEIDTEATSTWIGDFLLSVLLLGIFCALLVLIWRVPCENLEQVRDARPTHAEEESLEEGGMDMQDMNRYIRKWGDEEEEESDEDNIVIHDSEDGVEDEGL